MPTTTEIMRVEVEMHARDALQQFEKLDNSFRETAGSNRALYQQLWREHKKYVSDVDRENKKRASDEAWHSRELSKEGEKRKNVVLKEAREERRFANELTKEMQQRVKDERWLTKELKREQEQRERATKKAAKGFGFLNRAGAELAGSLGAIGFMEAAYGALEFGKASVRASTQIDSQTRALAVLTGSLREAGHPIVSVDTAGNQSSLWSWKDRDKALDGENGDPSVWC